ncbi:uncharacterized protein [Procambarus clarkii]|uniref:uncharacterized protein n=1 Tax=Procambarus clarkii TaxID=6728 RepID=UPI003742E5FC
MLRFVVVTLLVATVVGQFDQRRRRPPFPFPFPPQPFPPPPFPPSTPQPDLDGCNYYCIKPAGPNANAAYCCGPPGLPVLKEEIHAGKCPSALSICTRAPTFFARDISRNIPIPQVCPHDGHCPRNQKCCFDTCLDIHTCKPTQLELS